MCAAFPTRRPRTGGSETHVRGKNDALDSNDVRHKRATAPQPTRARPNGAGDWIMGYKITLDRDVLRAELFGRETVEETKAFFQAIVSASKKNRSPYILISVRSAKPIN